ncbi:MAG: DUF971 domain-containing protein [Sinobacteraceae bacterium]|nr:DUF971 domain-containing protein [Nevskiaceae bacterium]
MTAPAPQTIRLHRNSRVLEVRYPDGVCFALPCEYLRVYSPSAEVRGHGGGEPQLVPGKREVNIAAIEPVGRYAVRLRFTDGHDSGLYSWDVLRELGENHDRLWARYLERLAEHGMSRDSEVVKLSALEPRKYTPKGGA